MSANNEYEVLKAAIKSLAEDKTIGLGVGWGQTHGHEARTGALDAARQAVVQAIDALPRERARRLFTSEVAVRLGKSEKQTKRVLRDGPPTETTFHKMREGHEPRGFEQITVGVKTFKAKATAERHRRLQMERWVYDRDLVLEWWAARRSKRSKARGELAIERLVKQLADLDARLMNIQEQRSAVQKSLDEARLNLFARLLRANGSLARVTRHPQPFLVGPSGQVLDHAWLPMMSAQAIQVVLLDGTLEWLTLHEAITERPWVYREQREAWHSLWLAHVQSAVTQADARLADMRHEDAIHRVTTMDGLGRVRS